MPDKPRIIMVMGIGGTRKAEFTQLLKSKIPKSRVLKGSSLLLQETFNLDANTVAHMKLSVKSLYYESLAEMQPARKKFVYNEGLEKLFNSVKADETLIVSTHLMLPIYIEDVLTHIENMWDNNFIPYLTSIAFLKDTPEKIAQRRAEKQHDPSWVKYPWKIDMINEDQSINCIMLNSVIKDVRRFDVRTAILSDEDLDDGFCWKYLMQKEK